MGQWQPLEGAHQLVERLSKLVLRAQRLIVAQRLEGLERMVQIHAPALQAHPDGEAQLEQMHRVLAEARSALKDL